MNARQMLPLEPLESACRKREGDTIATYRLQITKLFHSCVSVGVEFYSGNSDFNLQSTGA